MSTTTCVHLLGGLLALALGAALLSGCSEKSRPGGSDASAATVSVFDSENCAAAREWAVHELDGSADGAYSQDGPEGLRTWWNEQLAYLATSISMAPAEIRDAEARYDEDIRTRMTPLLEKYGFDLERFDEEATKADKRLAQHTPPEVEKARADFDEYLNRECGYGGSPPSADVRFAPGPGSKAYCKAVLAQERGLRPVVAAKFDPDAFRAYATSTSLLEALDAQDAAAPPEIAADVTADNQWVREQKLTLLASFDYDLRRLLREGTEEQLDVFSYWDTRILEQDSRVQAYVSQVCGLD